MARKRMIDPNIWQSEDFGKLSNLAKLIFIALFSLADDEGRGRCNPTYLKSTIFPYNEDLRSADVEVALSEISRTMSVIFYSYDGSSYYSLLSWNTFQKIDKPSKSNIPEYDENNIEIRLLFDEDSTNVRRRVAPNKNRIEYNNPSSSDEELRKHFELIWEQYPNKKGKSKAEQYFLQWIKGRKINGSNRKLTDNQMWFAVNSYKKECEEKQIEQQFIKHGDTFFNTAILDYVEAENE